MAHKYLFAVGIILLLLAAAVVVLTLDSPAPALAQDGETCDGPCPEWIVEAWANSGHADAEAEAFVHWDEDDPAVVPAACARCHSEPGYLDYLGVDGSAVGEVDSDAAIGTVVSCTVCHNPATVDLESVTFPSGVTISSGLEESARCMVCHQGRESTESVNAAIGDLDPDTVSADLGFRNIHYFAAAASLMGSEVHGAYEFPGQAYTTRFEHVEPFDTCAECHSPHTLEVQVEECAACHTGVASVEDVYEIRMPGSMVDYDGDGSVDEGIRAELEGMQALLYEAIQAYASDVAGSPIVYDPVAYPYFFIDTDGNGEVSEGEAAFPNAYASWTPRLLTAAYNFQAYEKDPGAFAHNARYYAQVLYDSIATLNEALADPIDLAQAHRNPPGHFDGTAEAFRHWDADGEVPATCAKCHTSEGLPFLAEHGVLIAFEPSTSLACSTCHSSFETFEIYHTDAVEFPNGAELSFGEGEPANLCLNCHQGRESTVSVNAAIEAAGVGDDEVTDALRFRNIHYFAAGATLFGHEAQGIYEFEGKEYAGRFMHQPDLDTCVECHNTHTLSVRLEECQMCHVGIEEPQEILMMAGDWDGDGADEGVAGELETMAEQLYAAIQAYAADTAGTPIAYNAAAYPYWFQDPNGDGVADADEAISDNAFASWTPTLLRAAYNYQYYQKDPGAFAHNARYVAQALYDSIEAVGGADAVAGLTRP
jgi:osmotically-inducible protein OsmY